ncbi:hypothetical protein [Sphingobacterium sp. SYP-B4668]|nr:hypothetical protein [Sphingobacterium sp. SYP-B4668]
MAKCAEGWDLKKGMDKVNLNPIERVILDFGIRYLDEVIRE